MSNLEINENFKKTYIELTGIKIDPSLEKKIKEISEYSKNIGLFFSTEKSEYQIEYSNNICYLLQSSNEFSIVEFMIHNLCHYIVAHPNRREMSDFGLGPSPDTFNEDVERYTSTLVSELEERAVIRLSSHFFHYFNINKEQSLKQSRYCFTKYDLTQALINMNILDKNYNLTHQLRQIDKDDESVYLHDK